MTVSVWQTTHSLFQCLCTRLLHPQHLDEILTGLTPYRLLLDTLSEYPEPWSLKMSGSERERTCQFQCSKKKTESHAWGGGTVRTQEPRTPILPHVWDSVVFRTLRLTSSLFLTYCNFFSIRVLDTHYFFYFFWITLGSRHVCSRRALPLSPRR